MKKLCLIGCGGIGSYHLGHFLELNGTVELAGFCDLVEERAQKCVKRAGQGKAYTDFCRMYDEIQPDMVFICVPPYCHGEIEFETIRRGIPFFVEKPLALDLGLARQIRDVAEEKGLITAAGFQCRYSNLVEPNLEFCQNKDVIFVDCTNIGDVPGMFWWKDKELSGGQLVEQSIHRFDIIRYMIGEPDEVFSYSTRGFVKGITDYDTDDCTVTVVKFKNGALGTISSGCYASNEKCFDSKIVFSAKDSRAELKILDTLTVFADKVEDKKSGRNAPAVKNDSLCHKIDESTVQYCEDGDRAGLLCDKTFIEAVISGDGSKIRSSYRDAVRSVAFTLACNESMKTGKPVKVALD